MSVSNARNELKTLPWADTRRLCWLIVPLSLLCVLRAIQLAWLCDDAFISFRYARNLVDGLGLVFNAGEYVEGYTNLLWTLAIAACMKFGLAPEIMAHVLGIASWLALSVVLAGWSYLRAKQAVRPWMPLAAMLNLVLADIQHWATGGLETSLFSLLSCSGLVMLAAGGLRRSRLLAAGVVLALACTTRPDGVIFAAIGVAYGLGMRALGTPAERARDAGWVALPLLVVGAALVTFKLRYYGDLFPTAFYSKSALVHNYQQGVTYVWLFFSRNWFALAFLPLALWLARTRLNSLATRSNGLFLAAFLSFSIYVAHSSGDYMYARRLIPALPFLWLLYEDLLLVCPTLRRVAILFCATLLAAALPRPIFPNTDIQTINGVINEWAFYPSSYVARARADGELVDRLLGATPVRAIFQGGMCMFGYYSQLPYLVEMTGLTQYSLAKQPLRKRGLPGHEKTADDAWLSAHNIHLIFFHKDPALFENGYRQFELVRFGDQITAMVWKYSDAVMDPLRQRGDVDFVPIEAVLAQAEHDLLAASYEDAQKMLAFLERYYLADAPSARAPLVARLRQLVANKTRAP